jgi:hypothetical protein
MHSSFLEQWVFQIISVKELKLQDMAAESLSLTGAQRINRNIFGTFFNILEKVAPYNSFFDTPGNILNIDESSIQIINESDIVITEKVSKNTIS